MTRNALVESALDVVQTQARKLLGRVSAGVTVSQLMSAGYLGLIEAADRFDPGRGVPFKGYAARRIAGAMLDEIRTAARGAMEALPANLRDRPAPDRDARLEVAELMRRLNAADRLLVTLLFFEQLTMRQAGARLGVSEARVSQRWTGIRRRLRRRLQVEAASRRLCL